MKTGLVFGKFLPVHKGHIALIEFALKNCDHLYLCLCHTKNESIDGAIRNQWLKDLFFKNPKITIVSFEYDEEKLPNSSVSSKEISKQWAEAFKRILPALDIVFTSEPYGDFVAEYMNAEHLVFDQQRILFPVSATQVRQSPFQYWEYIPENIRYWFVKKICIVGSESTGKSTLAELLAKRYNTFFVPEMARDIIEKTEECTFEDLLKIALLHGETIKKYLPTANKLLFIDTDITITQSYSEFLFHKELFVEDWLKEINKCDLYLFLETDCEFVQDGTRLSQEERNKLSLHHKKIFQAASIDYNIITGDWQQRFESACKIINTRFSVLP